MKIRTDFVTNSSSSSFTLTINYSLRNGEKYRFQAEGDDDFNGVIELCKSPIDMANCENIDALAQLLMESITQIEYGKERPKLKRTSKFVKEVLSIPSMEDIKKITVSGKLRGQNGDRWDRSFVYDTDTKEMICSYKGHDFIDEGRGGDLTFLDARADLSSPLYEVRDDTRIYIVYNLPQEEVSKRLFSIFVNRMEKLESQYGNAKDAFLAHIQRFPVDSNLEQAIGLIDFDAKIQFMDNEFVLPQCLFIGQLMDEIKKRGGSYKYAPLKRAQYYVLWAPNGKALGEMLRFKKNGSQTVFVTAYQLWKALMDKSIRVYDQDELDALRTMQEEEKKEIARLAALELEKKREEKAKRAEEKLRLANEAMQRREAKRQARLEAVQLQAFEKQRILEEKEKARSEKEHAAAELKAQKELDRQESIANANIVYSPGQEPENIRNRINNLFMKLDEAYPDRIISSLYSNHKKWGETVTELRRILGYYDNTSFLEAYGYTVISNENKGGRPSTINPEEIIDELKQRYPNGADSLQSIKDANPNLPWKTLSNNAREYFGKTLVAYLKSVGIINGSGQ